MVNIDTYAQCKSCNGNVLCRVHYFKMDFTKNLITYKYECSHNHKFIIKYKIKEQ